MTAISNLPRAWPWRRAVRRARAAPLPPLPARLQLARAALVLVAGLSSALLLQLLVVSSLQQRAAQQRAFDRLRAELAQGTAPIGPVDLNGRELAPGSPVAYLEVPSIGLRQVVVAGTAAGDLFLGPGHRRDSPLPGQAGVSVVMGRRATYGGPFARLHDLAAGDLVRVTTGQGAFDFRVRGLARDGAPAPAPGEGRLVLATADGPPFLPEGVLGVDAALTGPALVGPAPLVPSRDLPPPEQAMASDPRTLWALALWLSALLATVVGALWAWQRWGWAKTWVVFAPPVLLVGLMAADEAARLLPNLM